MTGLEARYEVKKIDDPEHKHARCRFFVLDPRHDPLALEALKHYTMLVADEEFYEDLHAWIHEVELEIEDEKEAAEAEVLAEGVFCRGCGFFETDIEFRPMFEPDEPDKVSPDPARCSGCGCVELKHVLARITKETS